MRSAQARPFASGSARPGARGRTARSPLVAALDDGTQRLRVKFADPPGGKDRRLDAVQLEQLDEPPDADPSAEFALCELHWRLIEQPAQQHRVEIAGEVHRDADPLGPDEVLDELVAGGVSIG